VKTQQVLEKGLVWVAGSLFVLLVVILTGITIPPVTTGGQLRHEFMGNMKEMFSVPEISYRYWYLIVPSFAYTVRCVFGFCTQLDEESKVDMWLNIKFMLVTILTMVLLNCPLMYWVAFVKYLTKEYTYDLYLMTMIGSFILLLSVLCMLALFGIFSSFIDWLVLTIVTVTSLTAVNSVLLGLYSYQQSILQIIVSTIVHTVATFTLVCMLFAPLVFVVTLVRVIWRKLF